MTAPLPSQTSATQLPEAGAADALLTAQQAADACVEFWNDVVAAEGSFADEHSTL